MDSMFLRVQQSPNALYVGYIILHLWVVGGNPEASEPGAEAGRLPLPVRQQYTLLGPPTSSVSWTVDPAYACVLLLCACYLWLQPFFLHRVVCQLELDIARAEINLDVATQTE